MTEPAKSNPLDELTRLRRSPAMVAWQTSLHHLNNGRHAAALAGYRELVNQFPGIPQLWAELGLAAGGDLEFGQADQAFQKALQLAPNDATLLLFIGTQYYHLRRLDQALACLKRAVAADPSSTRPRLALGVWLERNRKLDEAWESVEACLSKDPKESQALYLRAFLLHRKGLNKEAESALRDFLGNKPAPSIDLQFSANHLLAVVLDGFGQYAEALAFLGQSKALRRSMTDTSALEQIYPKWTGPGASSWRS